MVEAKEFLAALQLADSFFPTGIYAHSHGLEGMVSRGLVAKVEDVEEFLANQFTWSVMPADGVALLNAHSAAARGDLDTLVCIDRLLYALKLPTELRAASSQLGRRLLSETGLLVSDQFNADYSARVKLGKAPGNGAVALGVIAHAQHISAEQALLVFCHSHAVSGLGAAMRLLPISHSDSQGILHSLHLRLISLLNEIRGLPWEEMTSFTPELDVVSMSHETDDLRLYAS